MVTEQLKNFPLPKHSFNYKGMFWNLPLKVVHFREVQLHEINVTLNQLVGYFFSIQVYCTFYNYHLHI